MANLTPGESFDLGATGVRVLSLDVRWDAGAQTALADRIAVAALPLVRERLESREHIIYSNQPATPDETTRLGSADGVVEIDLAAAPANVDIVMVLVFVHPRANAGKRTLDELTSLTITARDDATGQQLTRTVDLVPGLGPVSAAVIAEVTRAGSTWNLTPQTRGFQAGLDGALQMVGGRL